MNRTTPTHSALHSFSMTRPQSHSGVALVGHSVLIVSQLVLCVLATDRLARQTSSLQVALAPHSQRRRPPVAHHRSVAFLS